MEQRGDHSLKSSSPSHASRPDPRADALPTSLTAKFRGHCHFNEMGWESGPSSLYRGDPEKEKHQVLSAVVSCLESRHWGD